MSEQSALDKKCEMIKEAVSELAEYRKKMNATLDRIMALQNDSEKEQRFYCDDWVMYREKGERTLVITQVTYAYNENSLQIVSWPDEAGRICLTINDCLVIVPAKDCTLLKRGRVYDLKLKRGKIYEERSKEDNE